MMDTDNLGQHFLACCMDNKGMEILSHGQVHAGTVQLLPTLIDRAPNGGKERNRKIQIQPVPAVCV